MPMDEVQVLFSAHSIPVSMAQELPYVDQLLDLAGSGCAAFGIGAERWQLVYQSRSGPPHQPWLEPDVCDAIGSWPRREQRVLLVPLGFLSDHIEVLFDLDVEAVAAANRAGLELVRVPTVGTHPEFVSMVCDLVQERM